MAARRVALWQLNFIAYDNPFYFPNRDEWRRLRDLTRFAMENADGVAFPSRWVLDDGMRKGLLWGEFPGTRVIHPGTDIRPPQVGDQCPPTLAGHDRYVLCLGTDYRHKNRPFALEVFAGMVECGYRGSLVLAGPRLKDGSSGKAEEALIKRHPILRRRIVVMGALTGCQRDAVMAKADLVLHPSLAEGFGLVPFEAAALQVPCLPSARVR